jgi:hypothetical protein
MKTVYALRFDVTATPGEPIEHLLESIRRKFSEDWIEKRYRTKWQKEVNLKFDGERIVPIEHHYVRSQCESVGNFSLYTIDWTHIDERDESLQWNTVSTLACNGETVQISIVIRIASSRFDLKPASYTLGPPGIVKNILESYRCFMNGHPVVTQPEIIDEDEVEAFVEQVLESKGRTQVIVVLSPKVFSENLSVDPVEMQSFLNGFAHIVVLANPATAMKLTEIIGRDLSCWNGAVRLYWPGFSRFSESAFHPYYLSWRIDQYAADKKHLHKHLFRLLAGISGFRITEGKIIRQVKAELDAARTAHLEMLREQMHNKTADVAELEAEFNRTWNENTQLRRIVEEKDFEIMQLQDALERQNENWANYQTWAELGATDAPVPATSGTRERMYESVSDALDQAASEFRLSLRIWESAVASAKESRFARPAQIYEALRAIVELHAVCKSKGNPNMSWDKFFEERGFKYASKESQTTLTMHGKERIFKNDGAQKQMLKHLTLGGGDRVNCLQIYFEPDDDLMEVGYCGPHLSYAGQRT